MCDFSALASPASLIACSFTRAWPQRNPLSVTNTADSSSRFAALVFPFLDEYFRPQLIYHPRASRGPLLFSASNSAHATFGNPAGKKRALRKRCALHARHAEELLEKAPIWCRCPEVRGVRQKARFSRKAAAFLRVLLYAASAGFCERTATPLRLLRTPAMAQFPSLWG